MNHLTIGIFHDEGLIAKLGKKGTESDMALYNRKTDDTIFTFMQPVGDKLTAKAQIIAGIDAAIVCVGTLTPAIGETIIMLNAFGVKNGILVPSPYADIGALKKIISGTALESYRVLENTENVHEILGALETCAAPRDSEAPPAVMVDHAFSVKGVGEVVLGVVRRGIVKKHAKLALMPQGTAIVIRSIQMQDEDYDEAPAGARVGLALKGARAEDIKRGAVLCPPETVKTGTSLTLAYTPNTFYGSAREGLFHVSVGMQTVPARITGIKNDELTIEADRPLGYTDDDVFLMLDLNAEKLHVIGWGTVKHT